MTKEQIKEFWNKNKKKIIFVVGATATIIVGGKVIGKFREHGVDVDPLPKPEDWKIDVKEFDNFFVVHDTDRACLEVKDLPINDIHFDFESQPDAWIQHNFMKTLGQDPELNWNAVDLFMMPKHISKED